MLRKKDTTAKPVFTVRVLGLSNKIKWFWSILFLILSCQKSFNILLKQFKCAGAGSRKKMRKGSYDPFSFTFSNYILSFLIVSIIFCLLIFFKENLIITQIKTTTAIIEMPIAFNGNSYVISYPIPKDLNNK